MRRRQPAERETIEEGLAEYRAQQHEDARLFWFSRNQIRYGHHLTGYDRERFLAEVRFDEIDQAWNEYRKA